MNRFLLPVSVVGTVIGGAVLLKDYVAGGACPSKATIPGKTVIVTGANTGIGKQTALELAKRGGNIILACRDMEKCEAAAKDIRGETLNPRVRAQHLDLASLKSIREFAKKIIKEEERVDILVNNAAVMRCPHWTTEDGFEMQFGVNHLGHFLLTNLLLEKLKASAPSRIISLSSLAHVAGHIDFDDLNWKTKEYDTKAAYCQSKLAVVLFTKELSRRLQGTGVTVNALHPGVARTELGRHTDMHNSVFSSFTLGPLLQPPICTVPGAVISMSSDVAIFCRTPLGVISVHLAQYVPIMYGKWCYVFNGTEDLGTVWTPPGVTYVRLTHHVPNQTWYDHIPQGAQEVFEFSLQDMTYTNAGVYHCNYFNGSEWSQNSDNLELVVTGVLMTQKIWAQY
ncbi:hypothetical protein STEG23_015679, partial [Scotinomys teguina]